MTPSRRFVACCRASVREADILRLWLQYYAARTASLAVLIVAENGEDISPVEKLCHQAGAHFEVHRPERFVPLDAVSALRKLVERIEADWVLHVDSDEFLYEVDELQNLVAAMEKEGADYAVAWMADRLAFGGKLRGLEDANNFEELDALFPVRSAITAKLARGCPYKVCLSRWPHTGAIHGPTPALKKKASRRLTLEHFKWRTGLEERLRKRIKDHAASQLPWGVESERILDELTNYGRLRAECWLAPRSRRIHGWTDYEDIYLNAVKNAREGGHIVEVGVWQGRSLCFLAEAALAAGKTLRIDGVDPFRNFPESKTGYPAELRNLATKHSWIHATAANLRKAGMLDYVNLIQARSLEAARMYGDASLDFVWIDGDHSYEAASADLRAWWPRIIPGGALGGHDYSQPDVARAVQEMDFQGNAVVAKGNAFVVQKMRPEKDLRSSRLEASSDAQAAARDCPG